MKRSGANSQLLISVRIIFASIAEFQESQGESKDQGGLSSLPAVRPVGGCLSTTRTGKKASVQRVARALLHFKAFSNSCKPFLSIHSCHFLELPGFLPCRRYLSLWLTLSPGLHLFQVIPVVYQSRL